jgi:predicted phage-related endonuclease
MPITEKQLAARNLIGSSDAAGVLNMSPYFNAHDVYLTIVHEVSPLDPEKNKALEAGNLLEEPLMQYVQMRLGKRIRRNTTRRVKGYPIRVNTDATVLAEPAPVEGKAVGILNPSYHSRLKEWGEEESSEVPDDVAIQSHCHMLGMTENPGAIKGFPKHCYVPTILSGRGFQMFIVPFDREVADIILTGCLKFWNEHVIPRIPPPDVPHMETIKRIHRLAGPEIKLDLFVSDFASLLEKSKQQVKDAKDMRDRQKATILAKLGDAETGLLPDGRMITYYQQSREGIDKQKLISEYPEVYKAIRKKSTYRVLRIKESK